MGKLNKKRVYPSLFDIIGIKYMLRKKCSWCGSGHDARSKYRISHDKYPNKVFYSMNCYKDYDHYYKSNPSNNHKITNKISLFGVSHHRLIGEVSTKKINNYSNKSNNIDYIDYNKNELINLLTGEDFIFDGKKCTMTVGNGSVNTVWIIKKGIWGEHIIQANKLRKFELIELCSQL